MFSGTEEMSKEGRAKSSKVSIDPGARLQNHSLVFPKSVVGNARHVTSSRVACNARCIR